MILEAKHDRRPQTFGGGVYLLVVAAAAFGLAITVAGAWRAGIGWVGAGLVMGGLTRLVLPERRAGMLRVRRKSSDVLTMVLAGAALVALAVLVPDQPV